MKFEQVLQIYWSKGFLCAGKLYPFDVNLRSFISQVNGLGRYFKLTLLKRMELSYIWYNPSRSFKDLNLEVCNYINILLSQTTNVNASLYELTRYHHLRLYLSKTYAGRAHAIGKPVRGQRTWSNAWTSYTTNRIVRTYIASTQRDLDKNPKNTKINYKKLTKKTKNSKNANKSNRKTSVRKNMWF